MGHVITREVEQLALHAALLTLSPDHYGWPHPDAKRFEYRPDVCPGCTYSVIRQMSRRDSESPA